MGKRRWGTGGGVGIYCFANVVIPIEIPPRSGRTAGGEWTKHRSLMMAYRYGNGVAGRLLTAIAAVAATAAMTLLAPLSATPG